MTSTITVSSDIARISDRVMFRQLTPVPREHIEALVKIVLECAAEDAASNMEIRTFTGRIQRMENEGERHRAIFVAEQKGSGEPLNLKPATPPLTTLEGLDMAARLNELVGQRVTLGLRRDVEDQKKILIIHSVAAAE